MMISRIYLVVFLDFRSRVDSSSGMRLCQGYQPRAGTTFCCDKLRGSEKEKVEPCPSTLSTHSFPS
jgi:hypothetical protein